MRINKNKSKFLVYILIFCVALAGLGGFYLGKVINDKNTIKVAQVK